MICACFTGCGDSDKEKSNSDLTPISVQLDWVAEPEHGGFYTAQALGYFEEEGLDVTLVQGGAGSYSLNKVGANISQVGQADGTSVIAARANGAPLINIAAIFQQDPSVLMLHATNPVSDWQELDGRTIMARPEWPFLPYLQSQYDITFEVIPQNFQLSRLIQDPDFIQQGFYIAEPYYVEQEGVELKYLYVWDAGFDAYTTLFTNAKYARENPEALKGLLRALKRGYIEYIEGDPGPAHAIMLEINPKVTPEYLDWSRNKIIEEKLYRGNPSAGFFADYLEITEERFQKQIDQLVELGVFEADAVAVDDVMTTAFLPSPEVGDPE
ncbi:MAG: ABC transporter substrate-binding protein [Verrucomicrobia bacterium]|jgi:NitT/TauT family transport system substrate-binding protein|nr:ABC transporter substrate-binding protein [Verrucomicrobiota bacterium]